MNHSLASRKRVLRNGNLYLMLLLPILYFAIFKYGPIYGLQIAFRNFKPGRGIWGSAWVGFDNFSRFFNSYYCGMVISNTFLINLYSLIVGFPIPILLALSINEVRSQTLRKGIQTLTYMPHFISTIVACSMIIQFLSPSSGIINKVIVALGGEGSYFMTDPGSFKTIYVISGVWQQMGWNAIVYLAALSGVDVSLYEAARIDGASRVQKIWYIDIPSILPTIVIMLILRSGSMMNVGFEKILLLQNDANYVSSEVISTYVYRKGLLGTQYSFSAAVGMFNNLANFVLILTTNALAGRLKQNNLW